MPGRLASVGSSPKAIPIRSGCPSGWLLLDGCSSSESDEELDEEARGLTRIRLKRCGEFESDSEVEPESERLTNVRLC